MKNVIIIFFVLLSRMSEASSFALDSSSLRRLVLNSDYVIVSRVVQVQLTKEIDTGFSPTGILKVKIVESFQGTLTEELIDVPFLPALTSTSEAEYPTGALVLNFLKKGGDGRYYSLESTGGGRTMSVAEFIVYRTRIKEIQQIVETTDEYEKFMGTIEWLVKGLEHDVTRFETTFEFADFIHHYSRPELSLEKLLTENQKLRLKKVLLDTKETEPFNFTLVEILYSDFKAEIRPLLLQRLKTAQGYELWFAGEYMRLLSDGKDSPQMKKIIADFIEVGFRRSKEKELKGLADKFVLLAEKN